MGTKPRWHELVCGARNFHGDYGDYVEQSLKIEEALRKMEDKIFERQPPTQIEKDESLIYVEDELRKEKNPLIDILPPISPETEEFLHEMEGISEWIVTDIENFPGLADKQILKMVFTRTYDLVFSEFFDSEPIHDDAVFEACFFTSLCMFLHHSKRVSGKSIRKFIYDNSPNDYNILGSESHFDFNERGLPGKEMDEELRFRKDKGKILTDKLMVGKGEYIDNRKVYIKRPQGEAIPADTEHEWNLFWLLEVLDDDLRDTYKRIGNLYKDVLKDPGSPDDKGYGDRLEYSYKRFMNKLKQIKYDKFLKLQEVILSHICEDERYRGMNIYRFEKQLRLRNITYEVNRLLDCRDEAEENNILTKSVLLNGIHFPKVYQDFSNLDDPAQIALCAETFISFMNLVVSSCRLLLDEFVGKNYFRDDWETLFLNTINEMTDRVFYNPDEIDFTVKPGSQKMFEKVISAPVNCQFDKYRALIIPTDEEI